MKKFEDDGIVEEFCNTGSWEDCFFIEWLKNEDNDSEKPAGMDIKDSTKLKEIWKDFNAVITGKLAKQEHEKEDAYVVI